MARLPKSLLLAACLLAATQTAFPGGGALEGDGDNPVVLRAGGEEVRMAEFSYRYNRALRLQPALTPEDFARKTALLKLETAAAKAAGLDTLAACRQACDAFRHQLYKEFLADNKGWEQEAVRLYEARQSNGGAARVWVSHIFQRLPQDIAQERLLQVEQRFDSLYNILSRDTSDTLFEAFVERFSDEKAPFCITPAEVTAEFEEALSSLPQGAVSKPFYTPRGIHIVKVLERPATPSFEEVQEALERRLSGLRDITPGLKAQVDSLKRAYRYTPDEAGMAQLRAQGSAGGTLFTLDGKAYTGADFARFAAARPGTLRRQIEEFITKSVLDHEAARLEADRPEASLRLQCFLEDWLAAKMRRQVLLPKVAQDETGLQAFFAKHRAGYAWAADRYRGAVVHAATKKLLKRARKLLKSLPETEWENAVRLLFNNEGATSVTLEQGLFSPGDNPFVDEAVFKQGKALPLPSLPYTTVTGKREKGPSDYREVPREQLLQDYGDYLEAQWIAGLRASGKVEINQEVLKTVNKH